MFQQNGHNYASNIIPKRSNTRSYAKAKLNTSNLIRVEDENSAVMLPANDILNGDLNKPILLGDRNSNDSVTRLNEMLDSTGTGQLVLANQNSSKFRRQTVKARPKPRAVDVSPNE